MTTVFVSHDRLGRPISHALSHALRLPAAPRALATLRRGAGREAKPPSAAREPAGAAGVRRAGVEHGGRNR